MFSTGGFGWGRVLSVVGALVLLVSTRAGIKTELVTGGLSLPIFVCAPPGDTNRIFIVEQHTGLIRIFDFRTGRTNSTPFIDVPNLATGSEQGLLGLAFHPQYQSNGFFFVNITSSSGGRTEILRYKANGDPATADTADVSSRKVILTFSQPESNHNGGWIAFGKDGYLYISTGDGGGGYDQHGSIGNGQNRSTLLGKILRIDIDTDPDAYGIPESNPFKGHAAYREEIWAFGLRNPWRCSFDSETGHLWIGDVGQGRQEEIDVIPSGLGGINFGWRPREGTIHTPLPVPAAEQPVTPAVEPVFSYGRNDGQSVTGGYVYRGSAIPELRGKYLFGDYGSGRFWQVTTDASGTNGTAVRITGLSDVGSPSSFGEDGRGEIYVCDHQQGQVYKIVSDAPAPQLSGALAEGNFVLLFAAEPGLSYSVETKSPLVGEGQWTQVTNFPQASTNRTLTVTNEVTGAAQYFRLRIQ